MSKTLHTFQKETYIYLDDLGIKTIEDINKEKIVKLLKMVIDKSK